MSEYIYTSGSSSAHNVFINQDGLELDGCVCGYTEWQVQADDFTGFEVGFDSCPPVWKGRAGNEYVNLSTFNELRGHRNELVQALWGLLLDAGPCQHEYEEHCPVQRAADLLRRFRVPIPPEFVSSPSGTVGSQGEGTGGPPSPGACRPESGES